MRRIETWPILPLPCLRRGAIASMEQMKIKR
jgi:hypothetical protein